MATKPKKPKAVEKPAAPTMTNATTKRVDWRDPDAKFADDDQSLEAQMWRLGRR